MPFVTCRSSRAPVRQPHAASTESEPAARRPGMRLNSIKIESSAMLLRQATLDDVPAILALERTPMAREFVGQWSEDRHRATLAGGDARYFVSKTEWGEVQAYAILRGIQEGSRALELKRIVVAAPERGLGRRILSELMRIAFRELDAHRLFLDVYEDNARARHLYESLGFQYEGVMRDAARREDRWCNLHLMSILESEYS
jgi:diamine N-acetyltransferase